MRSESSTTRRWFPAARELRKLCERSVPLMRLFTTSTAPKKKAVTLGDFILGVYDSCGPRRAKAIVRLALDTRLIRFLGREDALLP